ncbi:MAG: peptide-methionine (S)-S-oxide reductase MsrA [Gammaproteobacteria bacterium]|nr:peptide-methionine (S)-S-oxide reductase MsrA [Gammaproteobacteria bacterium]
MTNNTNSDQQLQNTVFTATLAGGCYWCLEALFQRLDGVDNIVSGFSGGTTKNPTYESVSNGDTGHAEVIHFDYNPEIIDYVTLMKIFFTSHNPTTLNRQGNDIGTQYRSAVFYHDDYQKMVAEEIIKYLSENGIWDNIVTEITVFEDFHPAKAEHNDYFVNNPENQYCQLVIAPKLEKFTELFAEKLRT